MLFRSIIKIAGIQKDSHVNLEKKAVVICLDRHGIAVELGFDAVTENSMDAIADRDYIMEILFDLAVVGAHLSRMSEDVILWCTAEFGFASLSDAHTTGSSLMPQKKNPDVAELTRGKTGRLYGNLTAVMVAVKGLPDRKSVV